LSRLRVRPPGLRPSFCSISSSFFASMSLTTLPRQQPVLATYGQPDASRWRAASIVAVATVGRD
jgi:hypothetical protein